MQSKSRDEGGQEDFWAHALHGGSVSWVKGAAERPLLAKAARLQRDHVLGLWLGQTPVSGPHCRGPAHTQRGRKPLPTTLPPTEKF